MLNVIQRRTTVVAEIVAQALSDLERGCRPRSILTVGSNPKLVKSDSASNWYGAIVHLLPASASGHNLCPHASKGCERACLSFSGRGMTPTVLYARALRSLYYVYRRPHYLEQLADEIRRHERRAARAGKRACVRLNGTSDIVYERVAPDLFAEFSGVQFYDYTKIVKRFTRPRPRNYALIYSRSENSTQDDLETVESGGAMVAAVFDTRYVPQRGIVDALPDSWRGRPLIDGNAAGNEYWFRYDSRKYHLGLRALGSAGRSDTSGFVLSAERAQREHEFMSGAARRHSESKDWQRFADLVALSARMRAARV